MQSLHPVRKNTCPYVGDTASAGLDTPPQHEGPRKRTRGQKSQHDKQAQDTADSTEDEGRPPRKSARTNKQVAHTTPPRAPSTRATTNESGPSTTARAGPGRKGAKRKASAIDAAGPSDAGPSTGARTRRTPSLDNSTRHCTITAHLAATQSQYRSAPLARPLASAYLCVYDAGQGDSGDDAPSPTPPRQLKTVDPAVHALCKDAIFVFIYFPTDEVIKSADTYQRALDEPILMYTQAYTAMCRPFRPCPARALDSRPLLARVLFMLVSVRGLLSCARLSALFSAH